MRSLGQEDDPMKELIKALNGPSNGARTLAIILRNYVMYILYILLLMVLSFNAHAKKITFTKITTSACSNGGI